MSRPASDAASTFGCANCSHDGSDHAFSDEMDDPCLCYALGGGPDRCLCPGFRRASADEKPTAASVSCREFQAAPAAFVTPWHNAEIIRAEQQSGGSRKLPAEFYLGLGMFDFPMGDDDGKP